MKFVIPVAELPTWYVAMSCAVFGLLAGSFINVLALRTNSASLAGRVKELWGRSECPCCESTLRWQELIPVASWIAQCGRCRRCNCRIDRAYPIIEAMSGGMALLIGVVIRPSAWLVGAMFLSWVVCYLIAARLHRNTRISKARARP